MKTSYTVRLGYDAPTPKYPNAVQPYSFISVVATSEEEARMLVENHLAERKPLGFSEREIRKPNPKRTPWRPGLQILCFFSSFPVGDDRPIGVESDDNS